MTTYDEISTDAAKNFKFHTERAKFYLTMFRESSRHASCPHYKLQAVAMKKAFRESLKQRREKEYFEQLAA